MGDKNIKLFKGEQQELDFVITDDDNSPLDLSAGSIENVFLDVGTDLANYGEIKFELQGSGLTSNGDVSFTLLPKNTENLKPGNYLYEVYVEYNGDANYSAEVGKFFVKPRVDR